MLQTSSPCLHTHSQIMNKAKLDIFISWFPQESPNYGDPWTSSIALPSTASLQNMNLSAGFSLSLNEITATVSQARNFWLHPHPLYPINWLLLLILKNFSGTSTPSRLSPRFVIENHFFDGKEWDSYKTLTILSKVFLFCLAMPSKELALTRYWVGKEEILFSHPAPSFQLL